MRLVQYLLRSGYDKNSPVITYSVVALVSVINSVLVKQE